MSKHLKICDMPAFLYDCENLRISEDGKEVFYSWKNKDCSFKVYPSNETGFNYKIVLKVSNKERVVHTYADYTPSYVWEDGKCYKKNTGLLETAIRFSTYRD